MNLAQAIDLTRRLRHLIVNVALTIRRQSSVPRYQSKCLR